MKDETKQALQDLLAKLLSCKTLEEAQMFEIQIRNVLEVQRAITSYEHLSKSEDFLEFIQKKIKDDEPDCEIVDFD